jgi:hypothetical protein
MLAESRKVDGRIAARCAVKARPEPAVERPAAPVAGGIPESGEAL